MNLVVPWSTQTFAFMIQTSSVGYQSLVPVNKFLNVRTATNAQSLTAVIDENSNDLKNLQINYGKVYPKTLYDTAINRYAGVVSGGNNFGRQNIYQRYEDTFNNCQSNLEVGQQEPFMSADKQILTYVPRVVAGGVDVVVLGAGTEPVAYINPTLGFSTCDLLSRGLISCISVAKDSSAKNTDLTVNIQYNSTASSPNNAGTGLCQAGNPNLLVMSVYKKTAHIVIQQGATVSVESTLG
jgi:hypothetical protein